MSIVVAGCAGPLTDPSDERTRPPAVLQVDVTTTGDDIPVAGFRLRVGGTAHHLGTSGVTEVAVPSRTSVVVQLDLPANCVADAPFPGRIDPAELGPVQVSITCRWREVLLFTLRDTASSYPAIHLLYLDTGELHQLTTVVAWHASPRMSRNHRRIAFISYRQYDSQSSVYVMDRDGSNAHKIADPSGSVGWWAYNQSATWSADGSRIAFRTIGVGTAPVRGIVVVNADGSSPTALGIDGDELDGSPTRDEVLYHDLLGRIWLLDLDSRIPHAITGDRGSDRAARWAPDGERILVKRWPPHGEQSELWIVSRSGDELGQVVPGTRPIGTFGWSPDGTAIAYTTPPDATDPGWVVHAVNTDGSGHRILYRAPAGMVLDDVEWH